MKSPEQLKPETPVPDALRDFSQSLPMALLRTREAVMARFRPMLRDHEITEQQWRVLRALNSIKEPLRPSEVSQLTLLSMPSLSRLMKTLEERKLIRRATHRSDLRVVLITISKAGRVLVNQIAPESESQYLAIGSAIGESEIQKLYELLDLVVSRLGEPAPDTGSD